MRDDPSPRINHSDKASHPPLPPSLPFSLLTLPPTSTMVGCPFRSTCESEEEDAEEEEEEEGEEEREEEEGEEEEEEEEEEAA